MSKSPNETDVAVGARVRARRKELGLSQSTLGERLGISFQQVQKYEKGTNRIGAGRLHAMAGVLGVSVMFFFPDADDGDRPPPHLPDSMSDSPGAAELLRDFAQITDREARHALCVLARNLAKASKREDQMRSRHN